MKRHTLPRLPARLLLAGACALGLLACAQGTQPAPGPALAPPDLLQADGGRDTQKTLLRVIVQFRQPVAGADAALIQTLQDQVQAPVHHLSAISADTHVYSLQWPSSQNSSLALQRLSALPAVARVERDLPAKAH